MKQVMISDLKAHLSALLAAVRAGETVIVCDRKTPIAKIVPIEEQRPRLSYIPATRPLSDIAKIRGVQPKHPVDSLAILRESRDQR
jgi:prevent-host-death family protein